MLRYVCCSLAAAKIFKGLGPKRRESSNGDRVYITTYYEVARHEVVEDPSAEAPLEPGEQLYGRCSYYESSNSEFEPNKFLKEGGESISMKNGRIHTSIAMPGQVRLRAQVGLR